MLCYFRSRACPGSYVVLKGKLAVEMDTEPSNSCSFRLYCEACPGANWKLPRLRFSGKVYQFAFLRVKSNCVTFPPSESVFYIFSQGSCCIAFRRSRSQHRYIVGIPELSAGVAQFQESGFSLQDDSGYECRIQGKTPILSLSMVTLVE